MSPQGRQRPFGHAGASRFMIVRMSAFSSGRVCVLGWSVLVAVLASVLLCASAGAATTGYLYTSIGGSIDEFSVGADTSLTYAGAVAAGPTTPTNYPGSLVMAKTADGENLYELAGRAAHQRSTNSRSTRPLGRRYRRARCRSARSGVTRPITGTSWRDSNPAASGAAGMMRCMCSPTKTRTGAYRCLRYRRDHGRADARPEIPVLEVNPGVGFAYSGDVLAITGGSLISPCFSSVR